MSEGLAEFKDIAVGDRVAYDYRGGATIWGTVVTEQEYLEAIGSVTIESESDPVYANWDNNGFGWMPRKSLTAHEPLLQSICAACDSIFPRRDDYLCGQCRLTADSLIC